MSLTMTKRVAEHRHGDTEERSYDILFRIGSRTPVHGSRPRSYLESASVSRNALAVPCHELVESKTSWIE
jgi:hypothetical protein